MNFFKKKLTRLWRKDSLFIVCLVAITSVALIYGAKNPMGASSNNYCRPSGISSGTDRVKITVAKDGSYVLWLNVESPLPINFNDLPGAYNPLLVSVDNKSCYQVGGSTMPLNTWVWINYTSSNPSDIFKLNLSKGVHEFSITGSYLSIDKVELVQGSCKPVNDGSNCSPTLPPVIQAQPANSS